MIVLDGTSHDEDKRLKLGRLEHLRNSRECNELFIDPRHNLERFQMFFLELSQKKRGLFVTTCTRALPLLNQHWTSMATMSYITVVELPKKAWMSFENFFSLSGWHVMLSAT